MYSPRFAAMILIFFATLICFVIALLLLILHKKSYMIEHDNMILSLNADNFRIINDTYGILCGNEILKLLGKHFASQ